MSDFCQDPCQHLNITSLQRHDDPVLHVCTDCNSVLTAKQANAEHVTRDAVSHTLGASICKALGLDASRVTSLRLTIGSLPVPMLEVNRAILNDDADALRSVFEQYQITPIASAPQAAGPSPTESN